MKPSTWFRLRLVVIVLAAVAGGLVCLDEDLFSPLILSPEPWWKASGVFLLGACLAPLVVAAVVSLLAINPMRDRKWSRPTHHASPFGFTNPLPFFHFTAHVIGAAAVGMLLTSVVGGIVQFFYGLLVIGGSAGCLLGVHLAMRLCRGRMAPEADAAGTPTRAWRIPLLLFVVAILLGALLHVAMGRGLDRAYVRSCANHFIQHGGTLARCTEARADLILLSTADTRAALSHIYRSADEVDHSDHWLRSYASACPEAFHRTGGIGYVYVGDGLRLADVRDKDILILFCPAESHRRSAEHCHAWSHEGGWTCVKDNAAIIEVLKKAIARGESGDVAYSPRAMKVVRQELLKREK